MIQLGNKIRLSKDQEIEVKKLAAQQGYVIASIHTVNEFVEASIKTMDDETLSAMYDLLDSMNTEK